MFKIEKETAQKIGIFAGGVLFGTAGLSVLGSKDAKKAYTQVTAAALRGKAAVMKRANIIKENADDIYTDAQQINEKRAEAAEAAVIPDGAEFDAE